ncbi:MAG TPA: SH3 domain-containing protein, partial [Herpetosiphonaceae bacterium]|nr:SH3 domain-containing protein [Herpetosiphonaceae bacterium]
MSVLTFVPAATPVTTIVHTAPAAAFALAGASAMNGAIGGVEEYGNAFSTPAAAATTARVAVEVANVRSGPGLDYDKVGKLSSGVIVTLIEHKADWFKV